MTKNKEEDIQEEPSRLGDRMRDFQPSTGEEKDDETKVVDNSKSRKVHTSQGDV
jgi:hypothetical protein